MRIAFCGPSGTGKTTIAKAVAEEFKLPMEEWPVPSGEGFESTTRYTARQLTGEPLPYKVDETDQRAEFQRALLRNKLEWEHSHFRTGFVTDRTHVDNLAYSILHDMDDTGSNAEFWGKVYDGMSNYNLVIVMPIRDLGTADDPARKASHFYQKAYYATLRGLIDYVATNGRSHRIVHFPAHITNKYTASDWVIGCIYHDMARQCGYPK